jgi:hypothetical protein
MPSAQQSCPIDNDLYANDLMIRCEETAVRVSPQVWEAIRESQRQRNLKC